MALDAIKKLQGFEEATAAELTKVLNMVPVTENVSGLSAGDTIMEIDKITAGYVTIRGQKSTNPVVVLVCKVAGIDGVVKERPIFLSSFIRKHDLSGPFTGMIESDAAFKNKSDFDNNGWYKALKASAPFYVNNIDMVPRTINRNGVPTPINSRQIEFVKGENPKMEGVETPAQKAARLKAEKAAKA